MKTYIVRSNHGRWFLDFNCYVKEDDKYDAVGNEIEDTHKAYPDLVEEDGTLVNSNDQRLWDGDWVYIKNGKILHIDDVPAIKLSKIMYSRIFDEKGVMIDPLSIDMESYEASREDWLEYMKNPTLLNEQEDLVYSSVEARKERIKLRSS